MDMVATMATMTNILMEQPVAAAFGVAGLACQLIWPLFSERKTMLGVQMGIGTNYGAQYALLDAWSGAGVCALGALQTLIAFLAGDCPWLRWLGLACLPVVLLIGALTWSGVSSFFALTACSIVMLGRLQKDEIRLRKFMLAAAPFGMSYDLSVGAAPALIGACVSATLAATMLRREIRKRRAMSPA